MFWIRDPVDFIKKWYDICPCNAATISDRYNGYSRIIVYGAVLLAVLQKSKYPLVVGSLLLAILILIYYLTGDYKKDAPSSGTYKQTMVGLDTNPYIQQINYSPETTVTACNPYGNPTPYNVCTAVNQRPLGCMDTSIPGDQFFDKFYNDVGQVAPGLNFNRIPDTTLMARGIYGVHSPEVQKIVGETSNPAFIAMR